MVRGCGSPRFWGCPDASFRDAIIGFRPALEPLIPELSEALVGNNIRVFWPHGEIIEGQLAEYDSYDLMLFAEVEPIFNWAIRHGKQLSVSKKDIIGIRSLQS